MKQVPVSKSFVHDRELSRILAKQYALSDVRCQLISASLRDVYLVTSHRGRNILTICRHDQCTRDEVTSEWQFLDHLAANGVSVAPAVKTMSGDHVLTFSAPEGTRFGVLSTYAEGENLRRRPSTEGVRAYGRIIAHIHTLADQVPFAMRRPDNDINAIVARSITAFETEVLDRPDDLAYLRQCGEFLCAKVARLPREKPVYGLIHGDVIRANALVSADGEVTVIDFELCGPGWRAYDVASYLHTIRTTPEDREFERAFLAGYSDVRPLLASEQGMLPVFEAVRAIFSIGIPAMNIYHWGSAYFYSFLDDSINQLKRSMAIMLRHESA